MSMSLKRYVEMHGDLTKIYIRLAGLMVLLSQETLILLNACSAGKGSLAKKVVKHVNFILKLFRESLDLIQGYVDEFEKGLKK